MTTTSDKSKKRPERSGQNRSERVARDRESVERRQRSEIESPASRGDGWPRLGCLREHETDWPMTATAVPKVIGRSGGAVANCPHRLSGAKPRRVRLATKSLGPTTSKGNGGRYPYFFCLGRSRGDRLQAALRSRRPDRDGGRAGLRRGPAAGPPGRAGRAKHGQAMAGMHKRPKPRLPVSAAA